MFASSGYQAGACCSSSPPPAAGKVTATEVYFLEGRTFQNHHGGFVLVGDSIYAGNGHRNGLPICIDLATGQVKWGGDHPQRGHRVGGPDLRRRPRLLPLRERRGDPGRGDARRLQAEGQVFKLPSGELNWAYPVVTGGKLYIRDKDDLLVYDLRKA